MKLTLIRGTTEAGQAKLRRRESLLKTVDVDALPRSTPVVVGEDEKAVTLRARVKLRPVANAANGITA
jgi:hypothetical protein